MKKYIIAKYNNVNTKNVCLMGLSDFRKEICGDPEIIAEFDDPKEWKAEFEKLANSADYHNCLLSRRKYVEALGTYCEAKTAVFPE